MRAPTLLALLALAAHPALALQLQPATGCGQQAVDEEHTPDAAAADGPLEFRTIVGDKPIEIDEADVTPAFEEFRRTGENPFAGDDEALSEGKTIYARLCQACHLPTGEGRIGPSLRDEKWRRPRLETEAGRFEIIHSGGAGAMQAFHPRMELEEILKVMAWIDTFREGEGS